MREIDRIGVVVPAKDEEPLLPACLDALFAAARRVPVPVTVVIVLDACCDNSAAIVDAATRRPTDVTVQALAVDANSVGAARRAGMQAVLDRQGARGMDGLWLASTDADSAVPPDWLRAQLAHAAGGAQVVVGTIIVTDWQERSPAVRDQAIAAYNANHHRHVHGANLSFAAAAYVAAGGFPAQTFDEDVALVQAFSTADEPIAWAVDLPVITSARRQSRAPFGFAGYLDLLDAQASGNG